MKTTLVSTSTIDPYRVEDQKLVEHWGFPENIPPQEEWKINNGIL